MQSTITPVTNTTNDATAASVGSLECSTAANIWTGRVAALPLTRKIESATFPNEVTNAKIAAESRPGKMLGRITRNQTTGREARRLCAASSSTTSNRLKLDINVRTT